MNTYKLSNFLLIFTVLFSSAIMAQEENKDETKSSYYEQRARQDAAFEQSYKAESETEEQAFWNEQHDYENELKKKDKKAYKAYMKGKKDAYAEHEAHCDSHCHHSDHYHSQASFYYYSNNSYSRKPQYHTTINTGIRVRTPGIEISF
ncbi:MAG: hypothetical protein V7767_11640 [Leeuwenhoekiella sp.]